MNLTQYVIERKFAAPPPRLYEAFTKSADLAAWVWGDLAEAVQARIDLQVNGTLSVEVDGGEGLRPAMRGIYLFLVPGEKIIHTVHWDADVGYNQGEQKPLDEILVVDFEADGDGTLLRYRHMGIPDDGQSAAAHEKSVRYTLDFLERLVT